MLEAGPEWQPSMLTMMRSFSPGGYCPEEFAERAAEMVEIGRDRPTRAIAFDIGVQPAAKQRDEADRLFFALGGWSWWIACSQTSGNSIECSPSCASGKRKCRGAAPCGTSASTSRARRSRGPAA